MPSSASAAEPASDPAGGRRVPAPALRETSDIWFDTGRDPEVVWDEHGQRFDLVDPVDPGEHRLAILTVAGGASDPPRLAEVLAEGLAACDFPPTGDGASRNHVRAALRSAGIDPDAP